MDDFDRQLLAKLQLNNKKTSEDLGNEIGLSATAVQRRIKKLRESGTIEKEVAILNSRALGNFITIIVEVSLAKGGTTVIDNFKKKAKAHSEVQQCYYMAGEKDFILMITASSMQRYEEITRELFLDDQTILKFSSNVVMENVKQSLAYPF
ncbi:Lrp/AsnC family transcriptional regulator [Agarivorans sp. QJM3NY_29]|uniref:Lrp/AsnC family transcriptional regulator n=1 Tax=unclassified Agarivorans TaxID=2636026 RepID=UPI003D7D0744